MEKLPPMAILFPVIKSSNRANGFTVCAQATFSINAGLYWVVAIMSSSTTVQASVVIVVVDVDVEVVIVAVVVVFVSIIQRCNLELRTFP